MDDPTLGYVHNQNTEFWDGWVPPAPRTQWSLSYRGIVLCIFNDHDEAKHLLRIMQHQMDMYLDDPALTLGEHQHGYCKETVQ